jgi:hypothetical protein
VATPSYASSSPVPVPIQILDKCDKATFNVQVFPGACAGNGSVTFTTFINEVTMLQRAPQWRFAPAQRIMTVGQSFTATNSGGETHTFTEVDQFGGGVVPKLNQLAGFGTAVNPECSDGTVATVTPGAGTILNFASSVLPSIIPPGGSFTDTENAGDVGHPVMYQCCIHPWMQAVLTVNPSPRP